MNNGQEQLTMVLHFCTAVQKQLRTVSLQTRNSLPQRFPTQHPHQQSSHLSPQGFLLLKSCEVALEGNSDPLAAGGNMLSVSSRSAPTWSGSLDDTGKNTILISQLFRLFWREPKSIKKHTVAIRRRITDYHSKASSYGSPHRLLLSAVACEALWR